MKSAHRTNSARPAAQGRRVSLESLDRRVLFAAAAGEQSAPLGAGDFHEISLNLGALNYYSGMWAFADALKMENRGWMLFGGYTPAATSILDAKGFPTVAGTYHAQPFQNNPDPKRAPRGLYAITWTGDGDVQMTNPGATLVSGSAAEKRRVYRLAQGHPVITLTNNVTGDGHVSDVHVWMPDPSDPSNKSLEPAPGDPLPLWHPQYLAHLQEIGEVGYLRFMEWTDTNASPEVNWSDRRPADHAFARGETNWKRLIVPGDTAGTQIGGVGVAWEWVIDLANTLNINPWISVPHAASDDYVRNLADLFAGKSPESPGLNAGLKLYVEHSNEIWSNGSGFRQGDWAQQRASALGLTKPQFTARRAVEVFRIFGQSFTDTPLGNRTDDIVRVAAAFTGQTTSYTTPYLAEMNDRADDFSANEPLYKPHVLAVTTYFGGTGFTKYLFNDTNWLSADPTNPADPVMQQAFDYWVNDLTLNAPGGGTEGDAGLGGFGTAMKTLADQYGLKLVSYEGGPSLYTNGVTLSIKDGKIVASGTSGATTTNSLSTYVQNNYPDDDADPNNDDRFTKLVEALNRHPRIAEVYAALLQIAKAQGLKSHAAYTDVSLWNKNGQWGHKEYLAQPIGTAFGQAVKWRFLEDWAASERLIRDIDEPINARPGLPVSGTLTGMFSGFTYTRDFVGAAGDGANSAVRYEIIAGRLPVGLSFAKISDTTARLSGVPVETGTFRFMVRKLDADNDPAYGVYTLSVLPQEASSSNLNVTDDTHAYQNGTGTGINGSLDTVYAGSRNRAGYLKFNLGDRVIGNLQSATLRVYVRGYEDGTTNPAVPTGADVWLEAASDLLKDGSAPWTQSTLRDTTAPPTSTRISATSTIGPGFVGWIELDVTDYVRANLASLGGDGVASIAVRATVYNGDNSYVGVRLASREFSGGAYVPKLVLTQTAPDIRPPTVTIDAIATPIITSTNTVTVRFNEPVAGVDVSDFVLRRDGALVTLPAEIALATTDDGRTWVLSGLASSTAAPGAYVLSLAAGTVADLAGNALATGASVAWVVNAAGSIAGVAFDDLNVNGVRDLGEPRVPGRIVFLDTDDDGVADADEPQKITDARGNYAFTGRGVGTFRVRQVLPAGYLNSTSLASQTITLGPGMNVTNVDLGQKNALATLAGMFFEDANRNGTRDAGELTSAGQVVFLDDNDNGQLDPMERRVTTDELGAYKFVDLAPGSYRVRVPLPPNHDYGSTLANVDVTLAVADRRTGVNIAMAPATASFSGVLFDDLNQNGFRDAGEPGLAGVPMLVTPSASVLSGPLVQQTTTAADGTYGFAGLNIGVYEIHATLPTARTYSTPVDRRNIVLKAGAVVSGADIGTQPAPSALRGTAFVDTVSNLKLDKSEKRIAKMTVYLDANDNRKLDAGEKRTTTASNGSFSFGTLKAGQHRVRVVLPTKYVYAVPLKALNVTLSTAKTLSGFSLPLKSR